MFNAYAADMLAREQLRDLIEQPGGRGRSVTGRPGPGRLTGPPGWFGRLRHPARPRPAWSLGTRGAGVIG